MTAVAPERISLSGHLTARLMAAPISVLLIGWVSCQCWRGERE